jgi:hypothetical protein
MHFRRHRGATAVSFPQVFREMPLGKVEGDYFVIAKNIDDPDFTENAWKQQLEKPIFDAYMISAETLKSHLVRQPYLDMHALLDALVSEYSWDRLSPATDINAYHRYHSQMDFYMRSYKSQLALTSMREFPVRIFGRGWGWLAQKSPAHHEFYAGKNMSESQELFYSRYGLVDISPAKGLHDRTMRAMANRTAFLSNANLEDDFTHIDRYDSLFYAFGKQDLAEKCAAVMENPEVHLELAREFSNQYQDRFHYKDFIRWIDQLAKSVQSFELNA